MMNTEITEAQLRNLSIEADRLGLDGLFALCARASRGDQAARRVCAAVIARAKARVVPTTSVVDAIH